MGRRHNQRIKVSLPVRVFGTDAEGHPFVRLAHTVDVSFAGARIGGIQIALKLGDVVGVQRGPDKARFRVVWTGKMGSRNAGELGLQLLEPDKKIWGFNVPAGGKDEYEPEPACAERRAHCRFDCDLGVELRTDPEAAATLVRCTDLSRGGCYLETWCPLPVGTVVYVAAKLPTGTLRATGEVRTMDPTFGMGVRFNQFESTEAIEAFLRELKARMAPADSVDVATSIPPAHESDAASCFDPQKPLVLLAEDSRFLRSAYALYLRREGFRVTTADDGDQAMKLAFAEHPDVIVLDLLMPRLGGVGALKMLKEDPATNHIPVIVLSGLPSSNESKLLSCGAFAYLAKTQIGPEDLPHHVRRAWVQGQNLGEFSKFAPNLATPVDHQVSR